MTTPLTRSRRWLAMGLAGMLALGLIGSASVAFADEPPTGNPPGASDHRPGANKPPWARFGIKEIAEIAGIDRATLVQGLKDGKSLNQIITENGGDPAAVEDAVLAAIKEKLDAAVRDGKLTQEQADRLYARAEQIIPRIMAKVPEPRGGGDRPGGDRPGAGVVKAGLEIAASTIGIEVKDLVAELKTGSTIGEVATAHGSSPQAVIDAMVAAANARIDQAVADGKIDAAKGEELKQKAAEKITKLVNEGAPRPRQAGGGRPGNGGN